MAVEKLLVTFERVESRIRRLLWSETRYQGLKILSGCEKMKAASIEKWFQMLVCEKKEIESSRFCVVVRGDTYLEVIVYILLLHIVLILRYSRVLQ